MSIFFVVGKPGGGKSYYGVKQIVDEIVKSDRYIVTNIELVLPELRQWCHDHVEAEVDLASRIRILDEQQTSEFWLYEPGRDFGRRKQIKQRDRILDVPDFEDRAKRGCLYVIDEVHVNFGAREWQNTGTDATFFLTQHRKLRCDVILITQHPEQVDKALRRLAQDYVPMRNLSREPIFGFRVGSVFRWSRSLNSPTGNNARVFEAGFLKLDTTEYGKLYDTMSGVGIQGRVTPSQERKGRSLWWLVLPVTAVVLLVLFGPSLMMKGSELGIRRLVGSVLGHGREIARTTGTQAAVTPTPATVPAPTPAPPVVQSAALASKEDTNRVYMSGYALIPGKYWMVFLSDHRTITSEDPRLTHLTKDGVVYDGKYYERDLRASLPVRMPSVPVPAQVTAPVVNPTPVESPPASAEPRRQLMRIHLMNGQTIMKWSDGADYMPPPNAKTP